MHVKSASFSTDNGQTSRFSFFYRISNDKNFIPKYLDNALTDSVLTSRTSRRLLEGKAPVIDFRRTVPNGFISLLYQLRCHCNPDHNKFSSLSNTPVVVTFPNVCLWRRSLCSNLAGIDPEKLYGAIFICQYGLSSCIGPRFCSTVLLKFGQLAKIFWANGLPPLPGKKQPVRLWVFTVANIQLIKALKSTK